MTIGFDAIIGGCIQNPKSECCWPTRITITNDDESIFGAMASNLVILHRLLKMNYDCSTICP
jgi:hypothetical protein